MRVKEYVNPYSKAKLISRLRLPMMAAADSTTPQRPASQPTLQKTQTRFRQDRMLKIESQRFKKTCNLVEENKQNLVRKGSDIEGKPRLQTSPPLAVRQKPYDFHPKNMDQIRQMLNIPCKEETQFNGGTLDSVLRKQKMKRKRNLLGYNILRLQKQHNYSRYELHNLFTTYHTLLRDSKGSLVRFKNGFEVILNLNRAAIRPQILQRIFHEQKNLSFEGFLEMYGQIDELIFRQNVIDYVEMLFEGVFHKERIRFEDIVRVLRSRITEKESVDVAKIVFEAMGRRYQEEIRLQEITQLCHTNEVFAKKMYRISTRDQKID